MVALVTGATGFIGYHVARALCSRGARVRLLVRPGSSRRQISTLPAEIVEGDLGDPVSLRHALRGCRSLYHVAAMYTFTSRNPALIYAANVEGTRNILEAASHRGVERIVYTSSVGALASSPGKEAPATEDTPVNPKDIVGHYKRSKYLAQELALEYARRGLPIVIVNPSFPIGPFDCKPTPTGQMLVDFLHGRIPAYVNTGLNVVSVEDVAMGHLQAAEQGRVGQTYILGNVNLHLKEFLGMLSRISGVRGGRFWVPHWLTYLVGAMSELKGMLTGRPPAVPLESVRMARHYMYFDVRKAKAELGYRPRPVEAALERAIHWYWSNGYAPPPSRTPRMNQEELAGSARVSWNSEQEL